MWQIISEGKDLPKTGIVSTIWLGSAWEWQGTEQVQVQVQVQVQSISMSLGAKCP